MRRIVIISVVFIGALAGAALLGAALLFNTGGGRSFIASKIEPRLGEALGGEAEIGALTGAPPGRIVLTDVVFSHRQEPWLTIERAEMRWRPMALLRGDIRIDLITLQSAHLLREPPERDEPDSEPEPLNLELPNNLPSITIAALSITNFRSDLGGVPARLDGAGALAMGGRRINAAMNLTSSDGSDVIDARINLDPNQDRVAVDINVTSNANGLITTLAGVKGAIFLEATGDAPIGAADIAVNASLGALGALSGQIGGDLKQLDALTLTAAFRPGPALSNMRELGETLSLKAQLEQRRRGGVFTISELSAGAGALTGSAEWTSDRRGVKKLEANADFTFANEYRPGLQAYLGETLNLTTILNRQSDGYGVSAALTGDGVSLSLVDGASDLARRLSGHVQGSLDPRDGTTPPLLGRGVTVNGALALERGAAATANGFVATIGGATTISGDARYSFADETISFDGDIDLAPGLISVLAPSVEPRGAVTGMLEVSGTLDRFTLKASVETPPLRINGNEAPPLIFKAAFAGLPMLPTGDISARAANGAANGASGKFDAQLRASQNGAIAIPLLAYSGAGFALNGSGAIHAETQHMEIDVRYLGEAGAEPWPGLALAGDLEIKGVLSRETAASDLNLTSNSLNANGAAISNLNLRAKGPPDAIDVAVTAASIASPKGRAVTELNASGVVDAGVARLTLQRFDAVIDTMAARLTQPAVATFNDGAAINDLRLAWGDEGVIALDGAFSPARWRANATMTNVAIPDTDGQLNLTLDLDTNRDTPARGRFQMRSLLTDVPAAALHGAFVWDGKTLNLKSINDADAIDMDINLPARLVRSPAIGVVTTGEISGAARYDGDFEALAAYLPPVLQSLEGALTASVKLAGTIAKPHITGKAAIADGAYTEPQSGFSLKGLHAEASAETAAGGSSITFTGGARGAGQNGADTISLAGGLTLGEASTINLVFTLDDAELSAHPVTSTRVSGRIHINGAIDAITASGEINIDEFNAEIITPETTGLVPIDVINADGGAPGGNGDDAPRVSFSYDIKINADDRVFVRGRGLESEWRATARAVSQRGEPLIVGDLTLRRGWLDFSGRRFDLTRGAITFDRLSRNDPILDVRAEYETSDGVTAIIAVSGRASEPSIELISTPVLPSEDVMALVLFGKPAQDLSAVESLQAAQALASIGGVGPFGASGGVTGALRDAIGLDLLNFDVDPENGGGSLTIGKYVAEGFFVSATQDAQGQSGSVRIEYEITDNITVETEIKQEGDQTVSANWKRDF